MRLFKSRALAADACKAGSVEIGGVVAKPARDVRIDDQISLRQGIIVRTLRVVGVPKSRVGAKLVPHCYEDLTPDSEFAKLRELRVQNLLAREKGSGRPTKRDRRELDRYFGGAQFTAAVTGPGVSKGRECVRPLCSNRIRRDGHAARSPKAEDLKPACSPGLGRDFWRPE